MNKRLRHRATSGLAMLMASVLLIALPGAVQAAPGDLETVRSQLREIRMQAAVNDEAFNEATVELTEAQKELRGARQSVRRASADVSAAQTNVEQLARSLYIQGGWNSPLLTMLLSDPERFLRDSSRTAVVTERQLADIRRFSVARLRLSQARSQAVQLERRAATYAAQAAAAKQRSDAKVGEAQAVLSSLKAEQRRQLAQEQRRERLAKLAAARKQARVVQEASGRPDRPGRPSPGGGNLGAVPNRARAAIQYALAQVGKRYVRAGAGPSVFDCSGLTKAAYARAGVGLTHYSKSQWAQTRRIPSSQIRPGDLVFYFATDASHVAIYVGNGKMVSASNPDDGVELIDYLGPWYRERFSGVGRVIT